MSKTKIVSTAELLRGGEIPWPHGDAGYDVMQHICAIGANVIFEDDDVVAYEVDDDEREAKLVPGERRFTVAPKKSIPTLLDVGIADAQIAAKLLFAVQQVAFKMNLHATGFEVRSNVLPPYQRRPHLSLELRTGNPKKSRSVS